MIILTTCVGQPHRVQLVQTALQQCPDSAVVMAGYSQGAMLVHNAAAQLGAAAGEVKAAVTFGDPCTCMTPPPPPPASP